MLELSTFFTAIKHTEFITLFGPAFNRMLQCDLQKMNIKPGFSESVFEALTVKAKVMNERDHVSLVFDEMSIKQALLYKEKSDTTEGFEYFGFLGETKYTVNHAISLVVRSLGSKWKQPLGYFLNLGPIKSTILKSLTKECIGKLEKTGLNVVAIVCDQGSNDRSWVHQMENVTLNKPYIK